MDIFDEIKTQKQTIARCEKILTQEKIKNRKSATRRKIELGGLVIKSGLDSYDKSIILGAMYYALQQITQDRHYLKLYETAGKNLFLGQKALIGAE